MQQHLGGYEEREDDSVGLMGDDRLDEFAAPRRRWPTAVLTGIVMAVFAGGLWFFYHQGVRQPAPGPGGEVPLIRADDKPMKMKPDQPGGMPVPDQNVSVYDPKPGAAPVEKLLPPPEQPMPRPEPGRFLGQRIGQRADLCPRGVFAPMRRLQASDPPALLIDQHGRVGASDRVAHLGDKRAHLIGVFAIAAEQHKADRIDIAEQPPLIGVQPFAGAAQD